MILPLRLLINGLATARPRILNLVAGAGITLSKVDAGERSTVTIEASGGGGGGVTSVNGDVGPAVVLDAADVGADAAGTAAAAVAAEAATRSAADASEASTRSANDATLAGLIATEAAARAAADTTLTTNLATEVTNRTNADTTEATARAAADTAEAAARVAGDALLVPIATLTANEDTFVRRGGVITRLPVGPEGSVARVVGGVLTYVVVAIACITSNMGDVDSEFARIPAQHPTMAAGNPV